MQDDLQDLFIKEFVKLFMVAPLPYSGYSRLLHVGQGYG